MRVDITKDTKRLEAYCFVHLDIALTERQKTLIATVSKTLKEAETTFSYYTKISNKKKTVYVELKKGYNNTVYVNVINVPFLNADKERELGCFYKGGVKYDNTSDYTKNEDIETIKDYFNVNITNKETDIPKILEKAIAKQTGMHQGNQTLTTFLKKYMGEGIEAKFKQLFENVTVKSRSDSAYIIVKVWENDSKRVALMRNAYEYKVISSCPDHNIYNYLDLNRVLYIASGYRYYDSFIAFDVIEEFDDFKIYYNQIDKFIYNAERASEIYDYYGRQMASEDILSTTNKYALLQKKRDREKAIADMKNKKYADDLENMHKKPFVKNGIEFTRYTMTYQGVKADFKKLYDFRVWLKERPIDDIADFNEILNQALRTIGTYWADSTPSWEASQNLYRRALEDTYGICEKKLKFIVDDKQIVLSRKDSKYLINGIRVNKYEISEALTHILCHNDIESYNKFLESVSSCSLKFHKAIARNIQKTFGYRNDATNVELKMIRKKSRNFLQIGKKEYAISNTNKLIDHYSSNMQDFVWMLLDCVSVNVSQVKPIIADGQKRYIVALEKSKKLLESTKKKFDVKKESIDGKSGLVVEGKSGNKYLIQDDESSNHGSNYKTWIVRPNGKLDYRCIIDKTHKGQVGKDALVSRIFALANDVLIATSVHTLQGDM